jgi:HK97 family phage major capsid protein
MSKLNDLRLARGKAVDELASDAVIADAALYTAKEAEIAEFSAQITRLENAQRHQASLSRAVSSVPESEIEVTTPADIRSLSSMVSEARSFGRREGRMATYDDCLSIARKAVGVPGDASKRFRSLGENLQAIQQYAVSRGSNLDSRLVRAPTGAGEFDPAAGGFLVQIDFASTIFMLAHTMGEILGRVNTIPISSNANGLKIPGVDETSRATGSRWGGVQSNWVADGVAGTESKPKFRLVEFDLKKMISKMTVTDELLADASALTSIAMQAFSEEIMFMTEDAIVEGSGGGQPLGYMNAPATITVAKQAGQAATTLVKENIDAMWTRMWNRSRPNAIWLINQDIEPQLLALNGAVGTGGTLTFLPPGGMSDKPYATLYGRPVIATEYNATLGSPNDIALVDLSQYTIVDKGGVQMATSMHVAFDTDEMRFRITYRVDGRPMWAAPLTPFQGTQTKSPFVILAKR